jgi:hypothetical protein
MLGEAQSKTISRAKKISSYVLEVYYDPQRSPSTKKSGIFKILVQNLLKIHVQNIYNIIFDDLIIS